MKAFLKKILQLCFGGPKRRCVAIVLIALITCGCIYHYKIAPYYIRSVMPTVEPFTAKLTIGNIPYILGDEYNYLFDTGYSITAIYEDEAPDGFIPFHFSRALDAINRSSFDFTYYSERFERGFLKQAPLIASVYPKERVHELPYGANKENPYMVIGYTTIKGANWLLNNVDSSLRCVPYGQVPSGLDLESAALVLPFYSPERPRAMFTDLEVNGTQIKGVLIDTGSYEDLYVSREAGETLDIKGNASIEIQDRTAALGGYKDISKRLWQQRIRINQVTFNDITLNWHDDTSKFKYCRLGYGFFKRFHKVFIDSENKKVYCFDDLYNYSAKHLKKLYEKTQKEKMAEFMKSVGEHAREIREAKGLSRNKVLLDTGLSNSALENLEEGSVVSDIEDLKILCEYYGITLAEFFEGVEKSPDIR